MPWIWTSGIGTDKKMMWSGEQYCPWTHPTLGCISHRGHLNARKPRLKLLRRVQPMVHEYKCRYCGMVFLYGANHPSKVHESEDPIRRNPALIGGPKVI